MNNLLGLKQIYSGSTIRNYVHLQTELSGGPEIMFTIYTVSNNFFKVYKDESNDVKMQQLSAEAYCVNTVNTYFQ